ncbi:unnamed protein product [Prorocentrum cordatum]|uniref:Mannosyltransferase n=1 Tax=Prorocentrum cordatum TaxID=2364126 RepID=A0ABN9SH15_9DINO|nr:unnamed protein product [Polarella glacialis]
MSELRRRRARGGEAAAAGPARAPGGVQACRQESEAEEGARDAPLAHILAAPVLLLAVARFSAAIYSGISDCDETFNYWEPAHFITFGYGFQTWEYSPVYALRSYLFLMPHAAAAKAAEIALGRPAAFFLTRSAQAAFAVLVESMFAAAVARRFGHGVGAGTAWLLAVSPGPFMAAVAFLPSSIAMLHVCLVWALWLSGRPLAAVFIGSGTCVLVWPFAALLFLPLGVSALLQAGLARAVLVAAASFVLWAAASLCVDSHFYGRPVLPAWEIIRYNVLDRSEKGGPELYGVEPWYFYVANGFLNLTLALPAAAALPFVAALCHVLAGGGPRGALRGRPLHAVGFSAAAFLWFAFFSSIPHKEERFLVPAYPLLAFAAAFAACGGAAALSEVARRAAPGLARSAVVRLLLRVDVAFMLATGALSASRIAALHTGYAAPVGIYAALGEQLSSLRASRGAGPIHACLGAEWHRFMTSFFLPHHDDHLSYVRFGPTGLLPAEFNVSVGTSGVPPFMNDLNREEPSRYVDADRCDFLIDVDLGEAQGDIPALRSRALRTLAEAPFLDASRSRFPWRAFYVPGISKQKNVYASYRLLQLAPVARVA